jgi:LPS export ABC transporter protein LptC
MPRKKNKLKHILPPVLITIIGAGGWWLSEALSVKNLVVEKKTVATPIFSMKKMTASFIGENGKKKYTLMAQVMDRYSGKRGTILKTLHLIQHKPGNADIHTTANTGFLSEDQKQLNMQGNVLIFSKNGDSATAGTVSTDSLEVRLD